jgi:hypothetical protein
MSDLIRALSRLAGNRHTDGTSSIVSQEDRSTIIDGCHEMMLAARQAVAEHVAGSQALLDVAAERGRQVDAEGWTPEHDDEHSSGELTTAAACYLRPDLRTISVDEDEDGTQISLNDPWPWWNEWDDGGRCRGREKAWWKPKDRRRDLVRAAALIIAEIERLDRATATEGSGDA